MSRMVFSINFTVSLTKVSALGFRSLRTVCRSVHWPFSSGYFTVAR